MELTKQTLAMFDLRTRTKKKMTCQKHGYSLDTAMTVKTLGNVFF